MSWIKGHLWSWTHINLQKSFKQVVMIHGRLWPRATLSDVIWTWNDFDNIPDMTEDCSASSIKAVLADCAISCCPWVDYGYPGDVTAMHSVESVAKYIRLHVSLSVPSVRPRLNGYRRHACESRVGSNHQYDSEKPAPQIWLVHVTSLYNIFTKTVGKLTWLLWTLFAHGFYQAWSQVPASLRELPPDSFPCAHRNSRCSHWSVQVAGNFLNQSLRTRTRNLFCLFGASISAMPKTKLGSICWKRDWLII